MSQAVGEYYLRHDEVASRLGGLDAEEVIADIKAGEFGVPGHGSTGPFKRGRFYFVPLTGFNFYVQARTILDTDGKLKPVHAPTPKKAGRRVFHKGNSS